MRLLADGSSSLPCSQIYRGSGPASEPETRVVQQLILDLAPRLRALTSLHSFAQMWLHPVGTTTNGECDISEDYDHQVPLTVLKSEI